MSRSQRATQPAAGTRSDASVIGYLAFLGVLLATGIDIALPANDFIEASLDIDSDKVPLIITLYFVGMALGQLIYGPLADRFGRRPAVASGLILYFFGAAASALAPSFSFLLIARFVWGLGAAAPAGLRTAIARDLYSGDAMARITTIMMAVFLLGPIFMPLLGERILEVAEWPAVFWFSASLAIVGVLWCIRFGETLADKDRRPLALAPFVDGLRKVIKTRITLGYMVGNVFLSAAFLIYLSSAQPVFDQVFDRSSSFARLFALGGLVVVPPLLLNNGLLKRFGSRRMSLVFSGLSALVAAASLATALLTDGRPGFWLWYVLTVVAAGCITLASPAVTALALEPMGELAGTASSLLFFATFAFGSGLAYLFGRFVDATVTPFVLGFALYTVVGFAFLVWAGRSSHPEISPAALA